VKCHTKEGVPEFIINDTNVQKPPSDSLDCITCHSQSDNYARSSSLPDLSTVTFPNGSSFDLVDESNLCLICHQGRASTSDVNRVIGDKELDTMDRTLGFVSPHYSTAGATLFGTEAQGAFEYSGGSYLSQYSHVPGFDTCINCHDTHTLEIKADTCFTCHAGVDSLREIRGPLSTADYDGDGNTMEGIAGEVTTLQAKLYDALRSYAIDVAGKAIIYEPGTYPYFFIDVDRDGIKDTSDTSAYDAWTPRLLQAAYNYLYVSKADPGSYAHNAKYVLQILYDSLASLGQRVTVDMAGMVRPETPVQ
jgi:hypothetical protein